jgi:hypothetical protein
VWLREKEYRNPAYALANQSYPPQSLGRKLDLFRAKDLMEEIKKQRVP